MRRTLPRRSIPIATLAAGLLAAVAGLALARQRDAPPEPDCEYCGAADAPKDLSWSTVIAPPGEPGERLIVSGVVYREDGVTPAPGLLLYVWHTDAAGHYSTRGDETGNGRRHGRLRGWMRTDAEGRYRFETIRPAPYPGERIPAHIHGTLSGPGLSERYFEDFFFEGDPLVPARDVERSRAAGRFGNVLSLRVEGGVAHAVRDLRVPEATGRP
jgi:protocatechuate 3,4-dioxygenase beta subunit